MGDLLVQVKVRGEASSMKVGKRKRVCKACERQESFRRNVMEGEGKSAEPEGNSRKVLVRRRERWGGEKMYRKRPSRPLREGKEIEGIMAEGGRAGGPRIDGER